MIINPITLKAAGTALTVIGFGVNIASGIIDKKVQNIQMKEMIDKAVNNKVAEILKGKGL